MLMAALWQKGGILNVALKKYPEQVCTMENFRHIPFQCCFLVTDIFVSKKTPHITYEWYKLTFKLKYMKIKRTFFSFFSCCNCSKLDVAFYFQPNTQLATIMCTLKKMRPLSCQKHTLQKYPIVRYIISFQLKPWCFSILHSYSTTLKKTHYHKQ